MYAYRVVSSNPRTVLTEVDLSMDRLSLAIRQHELELERAVAWCPLFCNPKQQGPPSPGSAIAGSKCWNSQGAQKRSSALPPRIRSTADSGMRWHALRSGQCRKREKVTTTGERIDIRLLRIEHVKAATSKDAQNMRWICAFTTCHGSRSPHTKSNQRAAKQLMIQESNMSC